MVNNQDIILSLLSAVGLIGFFLIVELICRKHQIDPELSRRISHVTGTFYAIGVALFFPSIIYVVISLSFFVIIVLSRKKKYFNHIHGVSRRTYGEELLPIGLLAAFFIAQGNPIIFFPAFLVTGVSDPLNGYAVHKSKSRLLGSMLFFLSCLAILILIAHLGVLLAILFSITVTLIERVSPLGIDNASVPICVALLLRLST